MLEEIDAGTHGRDFLLENLQYGLTLAHMVRDYHNVKRGPVVGLLPAGSALERAADVHTGFITGIGGHRELGTRIQTFIRESPDSHCMIVEDANSSPSASWMNRYPSKFQVFFHEEEVYFLLCRYNSLVNDADAIGKQVARRGAFFPKVGLLTHLPPELSPQADRQTISADGLAFAAHHATCVFVAAYDNQSYLLWYPS